MDHLKQDILYITLFMIALFIGWVATGGPEHAKQTGSVNDKFQKPVEPINSGTTYDLPLHDVLSKNHFSQ